MIFEIHYNRICTGGMKTTNLYIDDPSAGHPYEPHFAISIFVQSNIALHCNLDTSTEHHVLRHDHLGSSCTLNRSKVYGINSYMPTQKAILIPSR